MVAESNASASEIWGESIDRDATPAASTKMDSINAQPSRAGTSGNNPADGCSLPADATDGSPNPSGGGSGPTQVNMPSGTEKIK